MGITIFGVGSKPGKTTGDTKFVEVQDLASYVVPKSDTQDKYKVKGFFHSYCEKKMPPLSCCKCLSTTRVYSQIDCSQEPKHTLTYVGASRLPRMFGRHTSTYKASWESKRWADSTRKQQLYGQPFDESYEKFYGTVQCKCGAPLSDQYLRVFLQHKKNVHSAWLWNKPHDPHRGEKN